MKTKIGKSIVSMVLAAVMCFSLLPMSAFAADSGIEYIEGKGGFYFVVENGVLTKYEYFPYEMFDNSDFGETSEYKKTINEYEKLHGAPDYSAVTEIVIPNGVTSIGYMPFSSFPNIKNITLPDSVTSIGESAFSGIHNLTSIILPNGLKSIGNNAFRGCGSLTSMTIPGSVTSIGGMAFYGCGQLTDITIGNGVTSIGDSAFLECYKLKNVTLPNSLKSIGNGAFTATAITSITIPESVTSIGVTLFTTLGGSKGNVTISGKAGSYAETYAKENEYTFTAIGGTTTPTTPTEPTTPTTPTTTDKPSAWAETQVNTAITASIVPQALQGQYTQATTRAEFAALAVALYEKVKGAEIAERQTFNDTTDVNIQKAAAIGVVSGVGNNNFAPNDKLTREQAATMLSRLAAAIGKPLTEQAATFADNGKVSTWAAAAVGQVQASGIMGGVGNNTFAPQDDYTREQSIATALRLYDIVK